MPLVGCMLPLISIEKLLSASWLALGLVPEGY